MEINWKMVTRTKNRIERYKQRVNNTKCPKKLDRYKRTIQRNIKLLNDITNNK